MVGISATNIHNGVLILFGFGFDNEKWSRDLREVCQLALDWLIVGSPSNFNLMRIFPLSKEHDISFALIRIPS